MADTNAYAVQTQQRWGAAAAAGHFDAFLKSKPFAGQSVRNETAPAS